MNITTSRGKMLCKFKRITLHLSSHRALSSMNLIKVQRVAYSDKIKYNYYINQNKFKWSKIKRTGNI